MGTEIWSYTCSLVPARNYVGPIMSLIYIDDLPQHGISHIPLGTIPPVLSRRNISNSSLVCRRCTPPVHLKIYSFHLPDILVDIYRAKRARARNRSKGFLLHHCDILEIKPGHSLYITKERWKKMWRSENVSGMQQVARFHDAGLRDRDKIHDPHWRDSQPISSLTTAMTRLSIGSISRIIRNVSIEIHDLFVNETIVSLLFMSRFTENTISFWSIFCSEI